MGSERATLVVDINSRVCPITLVLRVLAITNAIEYSFVIVIGWYSFCNFQEVSRVIVVARALIVDLLAPRSPEHIVESNILIRHETQ